MVGKEAIQMSLLVVRDGDDVFSGLSEAPHGVLNYLLPLELDASVIRVEANTSLFGQFLPKNLALDDEAMAPLRILEQMFPNMTFDEILESGRIVSVTGSGEITIHTALDQCFVLSLGNPLLDRMQRLLKSSPIEPYWIGLESSDPVIYSPQLTGFVNLNTGNVVNDSERIYIPNGPSQTIMSEALNLVRGCRSARFENLDDPNSRIIIVVDKKKETRRIVMADDPLYSTLRTLISKSFGIHMAIGKTAESTPVYFIGSGGYAVGQLQRREKNQKKELLEVEENPFKDIREGSTVRRWVNGKTKILLVRPGKAPQQIRKSHPHFQHLNYLLSGKIGLLETSEYFIFVSLVEGRITYEIAANEAEANEKKRLLADQSLFVIDQVERVQKNGVSLEEIKKKKKRKQKAESKIRPSRSRLN
ncbi:hypothetical protein COY90_05480 [Candidatus Roizmanbacteria bacterium CG_4_10_14_0_8_um_filter_39_9]|uniref:Uncharacterized protein n=1 Tax=Candidatus Roizmanbacteria bacterium CG_4_10_14_0_8_um_filter_39_9 TaxID=1974829 RepID=A0A2M7QBB8_9BACT|nr:MAG: hypothetical protein COY90_05480 [Candidatus Roizmanbacteria bacterium CG_4_10_14_0_8_um_filter_39_9]